MYASASAWPPLIAITFSAMPASLVLAGPPLVTDDPDTPGQNRWEINVAYTLETGRQRIATTTGGDTAARFWEQEIPLLDINYGLFDNDQLKIELALSLIDPADHESEFGLGDVRLGYKYRFLDESSFPLSVSIYPQVDLPTGDEDHDLGAGKAAFTLPFQFGRHFMDERLFVYGDVGYQEQLANDEDDALSFGVAAEFEVREGLVLVGEIHHHAPTHNAEGRDDTLFNLGFKYGLSATATILGAFGRSFNPSADRGADLLVYLGVQFTF